MICHICLAVATRQSASPEGVNLACISVSKAASGSCRVERFKVSDERHGPADTESSKCQQMKKQQWMNKVQSTLAFHPVLLLASDCST